VPGTIKEKLSQLCFLHPRPHSPPSKENRAQDPGKSTTFLLVPKLVVFGETLRKARRAYLSALKAAGEATWSEDLYKDLSWWRRSDRELEPKDVEYVDVLGRSTGLERPDIEAEDFARRVCFLMGVDMEAVAGRGRDSVTAASRRTIATLGIERWGQRAKELARVLNKLPDVVSNWASKGGALRQADSSFREVIDDLDRRLSIILTEGQES